MRVGIPIADLCAGIFAAQGILVALLEREASGKGQWLHTSLLESMVYMMDFQTSRWLIDGEVADAGGQLPSDQHPDRRLQGARRLHQHRGVRLQDLGALLQHPRRARMDHGRALPRQGRRARSTATALNAEINRRLAAQDRSYWIEQFNDGGVACGLHQQHAAKCSTSRRSQHLGMVKEVVSTRLGRAAPGRPAGAAGAHAQHHRPRRAAPRRAHRGSPARAGPRPRRPRPHESRRECI